MANNRMYLRCTSCGGDDCRFLLAKYYPSDGWTNFISIVREIDNKAQLMAMKPEDFDAKLSEIIDRYQGLNDWFDDHRHSPETTFVIEYETGGPVWQPTKP